MIPEMDRRFARERENCLHLVTHTNCYRYKQIHRTTLKQRQSKEREWTKSCGVWVKHIEEKQQQQKKHYRCAFPEVWCRQTCLDFVVCDLLFLLQLSVGDFFFFFLLLYKEREGEGAREWAMQIETKYNKKNTETGREEGGSDRMKKAFSISREKWRKNERKMERKLQVDFQNAKE